MAPFGRSKASRLKREENTFQLEQAFYEDNARTRRTVAAAAARLGDPSVVDWLVRGLRDPDGGVRDAVLDALPHLGDAGKVTLLVYRRDPAGLLEIAQSPEVGPDLAKAFLREAGLSDPRGGRAIGTVGAHLAPTGQVILGRPETSPEEDSCWMLIDALRQGGESSTTPLIRALDDQYGPVSHYASWALVEIGEPALRPLALAFVLKKLTLPKDYVEAKPVIVRKEHTLLLLAKAAKVHVRAGIVFYLLRYLDKVGRGRVLRALGQLGSGRYDQWSQVVFERPSTADQPLDACDVCGDVLSSRGYPVGVTDFRGIVEAGYDPFGSGRAQVPKVLDLDATAALDVWRSMVPLDPTDWVLCPACAEDLGRFGRTSAH